MRRWCWYCSIRTMAVHAAWSPDPGYWHLLELRRSPLAEEDAVPPGQSSNPSIYSDSDLDSGFGSDSDSDSVGDSGSESDSDADPLPGAGWTAARMMTMTTTTTTRSSHPGQKRWWSRCPATIYA